MTRADLKHCWKIPEAREELNRSVRDGRMKSIHSVKRVKRCGGFSLGSAVSCYVVVDFL